jgi:hypothetical protein
VLDVSVNTYNCKKVYKRELVDSFLFYVLV